MNARVLCCEQLRLKEIKLNGTANGIEFVEVLDKSAPPAAPRQQTLLVRLLRPGFVLKPSNIEITGGERIRSVRALWCAAADSLPPEAEPGLVDTVDDLARTLVVRTDSSGDHSLYTFALVADPGKSDPPAGFDARLSSIAFSFKVECPSDFDCSQPQICPPEPRLGARIDYLAKDYQGFRRLMLDRMNLLVPGWTERSAADLGVMLIELLAYAADNLSYRQDAIANEAYLGTARQRVSIRRHARLVDYLMHEGCNARAFIHFEVSAAQHLDQGTQLLTFRPELKMLVDPDQEGYRDAIRDGVIVFETAQGADLDPALNQLSFYTWGDRSCCLPRGSTRATLRGNPRQLQPGAILLFEEVRSPTTLKEEDADLAQRWAVRVTSVTFATDPSGGLFKDRPDNSSVRVTEIEWDAADALPFPLCLSVLDGEETVEVSVARGNIVVADHGRSLPNEPIDELVPPPSVALASLSPGGTCDKPDPIYAPARFRPALKNVPLTHGFDIAQMLAIPIGEDEQWWPASSLLEVDVRSASPRLNLVGSLEGRTEAWGARRDLLESNADDPHFVVEIEDDGVARLRFGDGLNGRRPAEGTKFTAVYRVGNGTSGNVGADSIRHVVSKTAASVTAVRNPLPAAGGVNPEDIEVVRRDAPQAFRTQERAVTLADYAAVAERQVDVQRAAASFRWTGSWYTVFISADRFGGADVDARFSQRLRRNVDRYRMAGYDLDVSNPQYVPLEIRLHICVNDSYFRSDVVLAVQEKLSSTVLADGSLGLFHPDNFTFGQAVYLSPIIAAVQAVDGVDAVQPILFRRMFGGSPTSLGDGIIPIGALEVAELAQDPDFRERGTLKLDAGGGK